MTTLRVGDHIPDIGLVAPDGAAWSLREHTGTRPLLLILHRHLA